MLVSDLVKKLSEIAKDREVSFLLKEEAAIICRYLQELEKLKIAVLFGSRARGDYEFDSDWDVLLVFEKVASEIKDQVDWLTTRLSLNFPDIVLSPLIKGERDNISDPLAEEVLKDGIILFSKS